MRFFSVALGFLAVGSTWGLKAPLEKRQASVDSFITTETPIAKAGLLANIGADGAKDQGAKDGVVIASPSKTDPNYVYMWVRDSSLVNHFPLNLDVSNTPIGLQISHRRVHIWTRHDPTLSHPKLCSITRAYPTSLQSFRYSLYRRIG